MVMGLSRFPPPIYFVRRQRTGDFYLFFFFAFLIFGVFCARNVFICINRAWRGFRAFRIRQA